MNRGRSEKEIVFENTPKKTTADVKYLFSTETGSAKTLCLESEMFMHAKADAHTRESLNPQPVQLRSPQPRRVSQGAGSWSVSESPQLPRVRRALSMNSAMSSKLLFSSFHNEPTYYPLPQVPRTPPEMTESPSRKKSQPEESREEEDIDDLFSSWLPCCVGRYDPHSSNKKY